ncbi:MAG: glycosyl hydrolase [Bacteroidota bacterium]
MPGLLRSVLMLALLALFASGCRTLGLRSSPPAVSTDPEATRETQALLANLTTLAPDALLFGHQDDLAYGVDWAREEGRSDVRDVTGSYPAVYGWDVGHLERGTGRNIDGVRFDDMRRWIVEGYQRGGVVTISWHVDNPVSGSHSWDETPAVAAILPGGPQHETFVGWLDDLADFLGSLRTEGRFLRRGHAVPIILRPFHEHTGSWFWWGADHCTPEEYKALWRFTVDHLRHTHGLRHLLFAYSPNAHPDLETVYFERYPGDDYVDLLGYDDYFTLQAEGGAALLTGHLRWLVAQAQARGKVAALTETGYEGIPDSTWFTQQLLAAITADPVAAGIAYVLVWRNAEDTVKPGHFYAPHPRHPAAADFRQFKQDPFVLFEDELPALYGWPFRWTPPAPALAPLPTDD